MLAKRYRFHGNAAFRWLYKTSRTTRSRHMAVRVRTQQEPGFRLAVVVSRKVSKSAVVRNRIRRRLFEIVRTLPAPGLEGFAASITVYDAVLGEMPTKELKSELQMLLNKAIHTDTRGQKRGIVEREGN